MISYNPTPLQPFAGGGIFNLGYMLGSARTAPLTVSNSIIANNTLVGTYTDITQDGADLTSYAPAYLYIGYDPAFSNLATAPVTFGGPNIILKTYTPNSAPVGLQPLMSDPQLAALTNQLVSPGYLALQAGSPAIDAADCDPAITVDIRGTARPQGASCDLGAYELKVAASPNLSVVGGTFPYDGNPHPATCTATGTKGATVSGTCREALPLR